MFYLESIYLQNFMGYRNTTIRFIENDQRKPVHLIFAPNGCGKSSLLEAIRLVYTAPRLLNNDGTLLMRKKVFNEDYDPHYDHLKKDKVRHQMKVHAILRDKEGKEYHVEFDNTGITRCDLPRADAFYKIDADNVLNTVSFQFPMNENVDKFLEVAKVVYNYDCSFDIGKSTQGVFSDEENEIDFYTDFIVEKYDAWGKVKAHYKSMSGGEQKLATMLAQIFGNTGFAQASTIVIDSFEKEIYYTRQSRTIDKLLEYFPDKQFFIVTHSETLINHVREKYGTECLYDIAAIRSKELGTDNYTN